MKQRIFTALILTIAVLTALFTNFVIFRVLLFFLLAMSTYEIYLLTKSKSTLIISVLMFLVVMITTHYSLVIQLISLYIWLIVLVLASLIISDFELHNVLLYFTLTIILMGAINGALILYQVSGASGILWVLVCNYFTDSFAYLVGVRFGKHKLIPTISPKKTWEGSIGGYMFGALGGLSFALFTNINQTKGFIIAGSLLIPVLAQIGDLFFSVIKRYYKIKDFSNFFPGHGGVLDRIDSAAFSLFVINTLVIIWSLL